jgi:hypothetical protein
VALTILCRASWAVHQDIPESNSILVAIHFDKSVSPKARQLVDNIFYRNYLNSIFCQVCLIIVHDRINEDYLKAI